MAKLTIYKDTITERNKKFENLVVKTQEEMKEYVKSRLVNMSNKRKGKVASGDGYVFYKGSFPVLLCAHMDTVHTNIPSTLVYANGTLSSTQGIGGDDRCGIYIIFKILKEYDCSVVFLEDEEIGCVGAQKFAKSYWCTELKNEDLKYIIEFDRKDSNHAVTYNCDNPKFDAFITTDFFIKEYGTCSDISYIAPAIGVAAVNLSCGYYKEHNIEEWVNLAEMETIIVEAKKLLERTKELTEPFKYIKSTNVGYYGRYGMYGCYDYDDDYYYGSYSRSHGTGSGSSGYSGYNYESYKTKYIFEYKASDNCIATVPVYAATESLAFMAFFKEHPNVCYADVIEISVSKNRD